MPTYNHSNPNHEHHAEGAGDDTRTRLARLEQRVMGTENKGAGRKFAGSSRNLLLFGGERGPSDEEVNLADYFKVVARHKKLILAIPVVAAVLTAIYAFTVHPIYRASVTMEIVPGTPVSFDKKVISAPTVDRKFFFQTQSDIVFSQNVATKVINKLRLQDSPEFRSKPGLLKMIGLDFDDGDPVAQRGADFVPKALIKKFQKKMHFKRSENSEIAILSYDSKDPTMAADIANAITQAYIHVGLETQLDESRQEGLWLADNLAKLRDKLADSEARLRDYKNREGLVDSKSFAAQTTSQLGNLTTELVKAQAKRAEAEVQYNLVKNAEKSGKGYGSVSAVINNALIQSLKQEQSKQQRKVSELRQRYLSKHPKMVAAVSDLNEANRRLNAEIQKIVDGIKRDYQAAAAHEKEISRFINEQKSTMRADAGKTAELSRLEREVAANRELYDAFMKRFKETNVSNFNDKTRIHVIDPAVVPEDPYKPQKPQLLSVAMLLGLFAGISLAFLREHLDNTFSLPEDIEEKLKLPALGMLPKLQGKHNKHPERRYIADKTAPFAEAVNGVRTGILFSDIDNPPKAIMVTSAHPGEGKTTTSSNLALSFSQLGRTLLIDADMRKPSIAKTVAGVGAHAGLSNLISGQKKFHECLLRDKEVENLYFMPSGTIPPNPLEILSSARFEKVFEFLRKYFAYIVVDCPPVLPVSDALIAGQLVDCVVYVTKANDTTDASAREAVKRLRSARLEPFGAVLTQVELDKLGNSYGGYEYYGEGYRYGAEKS